MSTGRLTFLYPHLLRTAYRAGGGNPALSAREVGGWAVARRGKGTFAKRAGKAVEPVAFGKGEGQKKVSGDGQKPKDTDAAAAAAAVPLKKADLDPEPGTMVAKVAAESTEEGSRRLATERLADKKASTTETGAGETGADGMIGVKEAKLVQPTDADIKSPSPTDTEPTSSTTDSNSNTGAASDKAKEGVEGDKAARQAKKNGPIEAVLHMQPPAGAAKLHPSMSPPPYVHHFDSYSLVKELEGGGFSKGQATTAMKGIRAILAQHLDIAQESLVSKSDVENEVYLFQAACSEMGTEMTNNRRLRDEQIRQQRSHLQNEVDVLTQSLNQELLTLNDDVRGMFNDRKMAVSEEQKSADSAVQQINYKISILLTSDSKSEIEAVRWTLIRRSVLGILFMAILTLGTLRYATFVGQQRKKESERQAKEEEQLKKDGGTKDHSNGPDAAVILAAN